MLTLCKLLETDNKQSLPVLTCKVNQRRMACIQQQTHPAGTARENVLFYHLSHTQYFMVVTMFPAQIVLHVVDAELVQRELACAPLSGVVLPFPK